MTTGRDLTVTKQYLAGEVSWPGRVGAIPALADCYQLRGETDLLREAVDAGGTAVLTQVLSGLGGVGKSQLASAYARSVAGELDLLVWVSATDRAAVLASYAQAAIQWTAHRPDDRRIGRRPHTGSGERGGERSGPSGRAA